MVAARSKLVRPGGDGANADARDGAQLTRLLRLGEITAVTVPECDVEAVRDLVRAREDARAGLMRVRHWLPNCCCAKAECIKRAGLGPVARDVAGRQRVDDSYTTAAFDRHFDAVLSVTSAWDRLEEQIIAMVASARWADPVDRLDCLRSIAALTGLAFG